MTKEEANKALMRRWYDEMWARRDFDLIPELAGPVYTRHDVVGDRAVTAEEYRDQMKAAASDWTIDAFHYFLIAEGDYVTAIGTWTINGGQQWDWVQAFRVEDGKLVETWLPGMAVGDTAHWTPTTIPTP